MSLNHYLLPSLRTDKQLMLPSLILAVSTKRLVNQQYLMLSLFYSYTIVNAVKTTYSWQNNPVGGELGESPVRNTGGLSQHPVIVVLFDTAQRHYTLF
jgi:hypothetical protein